MAMKFALQLYSLRNRMEEGFEAQLKKVAAMGYQGVELAGLHNLPAERMKALLKELQLCPVGAHTPLEELENDLDAVIAYHKTVGTKAIVIPYATYETRSDVERVVSLARRAAPAVNAAGMALLYHNHQQEFTTRFGGKTVLELLEEQVDALGFELDVFWAAYAGLDPVAVMKSLGGRCALVHLKDMNSPQEKKMTEVGTGVIDFARILEQCRQMGHSWGVVEQDDIYMEEYQSVKVSLENLKKLS